MWESGERVFVSDPGRFLNDWATVARPATRNGLVLVALDSGFGGIPHVVDPGWCWSCPEQRNFDELCKEV